MANRRQALKQALEGAVVHPVRELFLLGEAPPLPPGWDTARAQEVAASARERLVAARRLLATGASVPALVLYRDAALELERGLAQFAGESENALRADLASATQAAHEPAASAEAREDLADDLEALTGSALAVLGALPPEERRKQRRLRLAALGACAAALLLCGGAYLFRAPNLALHRSATASSSGLGTTPAGAVDGVRYGWLGYHSATQNGEWWAVDLGRVYALDHVTVYGRIDCCFDQSVPLALEISLDGLNYRPLAKRIEAFSQLDPWRVPGEANEARFVRVRSLRKSLLVLGEVEVFGKAR